MYLKEITEKIISNEEFLEWEIVDEKDETVILTTTFSLSDVDLSYELYIILTTKTISVFSEMFDIEKTSETLGIVNDYNNRKARIFHANIQSIDYDEDKNETFYGLYMESTLYLAEEVSAESYLKAFENIYEDLTREVTVDEIIELKEKLNDNQI